MEPEDPRFCAFQLWSRKLEYGCCGSAHGSFYRNPCSPNLCPLFDLSNKMRDRFKEIFGYEHFMSMLTSQDSEVKQT